ncbi:MAG: 2-oxoacid:acceptor oxidoreductase family protein [Sphingomonadales bacterium]
MTTVLRILIAGVGGQGIHGFVKILQQHLYAEGYELISARYKGGAQSLGSVHAECKIFLQDTAQQEQMSSQIIPGTLDVLLGLERYETLRFLPYCNANTLIVCDHYTEFPPGTKRQPHQANIDTFFSSLSNPLVSKDFVALAKQTGLEKSKLPILLFNEACTALKVPFKPIPLNLSL